jgi:AraC family transcriptional regulator
MPVDALDNAVALLTFRTLYDSPMIGVRDYICRDTTCTRSAEEHSDVNSIVLMRHGAFTKHFGKRQVTADVNQATFFAKDSVYQVSHPVDHGDRGTTFTIAPTILTDIVRELDPGIDDHPDAPFPFLTGPCEASVFWRHRDFVRRLESAQVEPLEPLWADVTGLQLVADVLEAAFAQHGIKRTRRATTNADHAERTEAAKTYLAAHMSDGVTLDHVSTAVNSSPFNFARIFQQQTGLPVHRYLTLLRLRASLELIAAANADLTSVALDLGFSSHSHFTDVFRREFGETPSDFRRKLTNKAIRQMSKDLIAGELRSPIS